MYIRIKKVDQSGPILDLLKPMEFAAVLELHKHQHNKPDACVLC